MAKNKGLENNRLTKLDGYSCMAFYYQQRYVANFIKQKQKAFYRQMISDHRGDYKYLFSLTNGLLFRNEPFPLPIHDSKQQLANDFNDFFKTKIKLIMQKLKPNKPDDTNNDFIKHDYLTDLRFHEFREVTPESEDDSEEGTIKIL